MNCIKLLSLLAFFGLTTSKKISPVILIPGYGGSRIEAKLTNKTEPPHSVCQKNSKDFFSLWLNLEMLVPTMVDCWADNIRMVYDNKTHTTHPPEGVKTRIPLFGDPIAVEHVNAKETVGSKYFVALANALVEKGYERNVSLRGAPYDFRKAPHENKKWFDDMKKLVEETYNKNHKMRVVLVAHSFGAPMTMHFLQKMDQKWKDTHVAALVSLAGAYGGTVKSIELYTVGENHDLFLLDAEVQREVQITWSSPAYLLPKPQFFDADQPFIEAFNKNFTLSNIDDMFTNLSCPDCIAMLKDAQPYRLNFKPPGVEVHCLHGSGIKTIEKLVQNKEKPNDYPDKIYGEGDGTVNAKSLEACLKWNGTQPQKFFHQVFPNVDHSQIINNKDMIDNIIAIIKLFD